MKCSTASFPLGSSFTKTLLQREVNCQLSIACPGRGNCPALSATCNPLGNVCPGEPKIY